MTRTYTIIRLKHPGRLAKSVDEVQTIVEWETGKPFFLMDPEGTVAEFSTVTDATRNRISEFIQRVPERSVFVGRMSERQEV